MRAETLVNAAGFRPVRGAGLPLFWCERGDATLFYAPGCLCVVAAEHTEAFQATLGPQATGWAGRLWQHAVQTAMENAHRRQAPFYPTSLTLALNNACNLNCTYCFGDPSPSPTVSLDPAAVTAAATLVAAQCRQYNHRFTVVFDGGGEPTLDLNQLEALLARVEGIAATYGVPLFRAIVTNGFLPESGAVWLARHFDLVTLSCDGPPELQDLQRPPLNGLGSARIVERTAHILRDEGRPFHVRVTITAANLNRQAEIAAYLCYGLVPQEIHVEPVHRGGRGTALPPERAAEFVDHFLAAQAAARRYGIPWVSSGSRPSEQHGPHCHLFHAMLHLVPGEVATVCFKLSTALQVLTKAATIGTLDRATGRFVLDEAHLQTLRSRLSTLLPPCADCFNRYHCAQECPDSCPLDLTNEKEQEKDQERELAAPGFRCQVQRALTLATLYRAADRLWAVERALPEAMREPVYGTETL